MRAKRLLMALAMIALAASSAIAQAAPWALQRVVAFCCCGPHTLDDACHCPDCPSADEGAARQRSEDDDSGPAMRRCQLERTFATSPVAPQVAPSRVALALTRRPWSRVSYQLLASLRSIVADSIERPPRR